MILTFTTMFALWVLTVTMLAVWYGVLIAVGAVAITLAVILFAFAQAIAWCVDLIGALALRFRRAAA